MRDEVTIGESAAEAPNAPEAQEGWFLDWLIPWAVGAGLVVVLLLGLFTVSNAADGADAAAGWIAAGLALLALALGLKLYWDGGSTAPWRLVLVEGSDALLVLSALLTALAIGGLQLAARWPDGVVHDAGWALSGFSLALLFWNLKHYFDRREA
jgi:hypothetical protein